MPLCNNSIFASKTSFAIYNSMLRLVLSLVFVASVVTAAEYGSTNYDDIYGYEGKKYDYEGYNSGYDSNNYGYDNSYGNMYGSNYKAPSYGYDSYDYGYGNQYGYDKQPYGYQSNSNGYDYKPYGYGEKHHSKKHSSKKY